MKSMNYISIEPLHNNYDVNIFSCILTVISIVLYDILYIIHYILILRRNIFHNTCNYAPDMLYTC